MRQKFDVEKFVTDRKINDISDGMTTNSDLLGFYGYQESLWDSMIDNLKLQIENRSAFLELDIRSGLEKMTDATVKAKVAADAEIQKLKKALLIAKEQSALYTNACRALDQKGKMLISLGAWKRSEIDGLGMRTPNVSEPRIDPERRREIQKRLAKSDGNSSIFS